MKPKYSKKLIVSLITDDLIHAKLTNGLEELGLNPVSYSLYLSQTIIGLMGFEGAQNEVVFEYYLEQLKQARLIDNSDNNKAMSKLAHNIYRHLQRPLLAKK